MSELNGRIVAHRNDRMGGRLISILNAIRISRDYGIPFVVAWVNHGRTAEELKTPTDIFTPDFVERHFVDGAIDADAWAALDDLDATQFRNAENMREAAARGAGFLSQRSVGATVLPWEDEGEVRLRLAQCFDGIGFSDAIRRVSAQIDNRLAGTHLTAYHIRRGDIISNPITSQKLWPNKYIPREFYEVHLLRQMQDPEAACLVFSDTHHEVEQLKSLDARVLSFEDLVDGEDLAPGQRDFLELFAMSRCREIFGPPHSAFSQTAATLGGCTVYPVQESLSETERGEAMELMIARMDAPETHFLGDGDLGQCFPFVVEHLRASGQHPRARNLLAAQVNRGFTRAYAFPLISELCVECDDIGGCLKVQEAAWQRPVTGDEALGPVAAHAALAHVAAGDAAMAHRLAHAAWWFGPLERMVNGTLNLLLSAGWMAGAPSYPIDQRMVGRKGNSFPVGDAYLKRLNAVVPPGGLEERIGYPWQVALRDWRLVHGKRVGRAYWNNNRIRNTLNRFEKSHPKKRGTPELASLEAVLLRDLGELDEARARNSAALAAYPGDPLYLKREADILLEAGEIDEGISRLEEATDGAGRDICYLATLGHWYGRAKRPDEMASVFDEISKCDHNLIEIKLMTADVLRRQTATRETALQQIDAAVELGHGSQRLIGAKARILSELGRHAEAARLYEGLARSGVAQPSVFVTMYRAFKKAGDLVPVEKVVAQSPYDIAEIRELAGDL